MQNPLGPPAVSTPTVSVAHQTFPAVQARGAAATTAVAALVSSSSGLPSSSWNVTFTFTVLPSSAAPNR